MGLRNYGSMCGPGVHVSVKKSFGKIMNKGSCVAVSHLFYTVCVFATHAQLMSTA